MAARSSVTIFGLGLIGGSIGKALRARDWHVRYVDPAVDLEMARTAGAADERFIGTDLGDLVIVATPVDRALALIPTLDAPLITTTGSVLMPFGSQERVIAGHPMAGSQASGLDAARIDLFVGRRWFLARDHPLLRRMVQDTGADCEIVDPALHDRCVAITSHLPQILSTALAAYIAEEGAPDLLPFAGNGLQTFLRLAGSDAGIWQPVIEANRQHIEKDIAALSAIVDRILQGDKQPFEEARAVFAALRKP